MNDLPQTEAPSIDPSAGLTPNGDAPFNPLDVQRVPIREDIRESESYDLSQGPGASTLVEREKQIAIAAKAYLPMCKAFVGVYNSAVANVVVTTAVNSGYSDEEGEMMGTKSELKPDTKDLMIQSASRIAARRVKNPEHMDLAGLAGAFAEHLAGVMLIIKYIRKNPRHPEEK